MRVGRGCAALLVGALALPPTLAAQEAPGEATGSRASSATSVPYRSPPSGTTLDVPFVPQSPALCGGAAVAMVLRYWGERGIYAEEFAPLVVESGEGIRTSDLTGAVRRRGWRAQPFTGTDGMVREHLEHGWPVIALIAVGRGRYHYVVIVGWDEGSVRFHDPARGPLRTMARTAFERAWQPASRWALLVLPAAEPDEPDAVEAAEAAESADTADVAALAGAPQPARSGAPAQSRAPESATPGAPPGSSACVALIAAAAEAAAAADYGEAERALDGAEIACLDPAGVALERAGLRFRQGRYADAAGLAAGALAGASGDGRANPYAWDLLASSRYLLDDTEGALDAWNRIGRPRNDLTRVDGLGRTRFHVPYQATGIGAGDLVTPDGLARARRRVADLPTVAASRVDYRPVRGGDVELHVGVLERPVLPVSPVDLAAHALRAATDRRTELTVAGPLGAGERWRVEREWQRKRRALELSLAVPGAFGVSGVWELRARDQVRTYHPNAVGGAGDHRETRRTVALGLSHWATGTLRWGVGGSMDEWSDPGPGGWARRFAGLAVGLELRERHDRAAVHFAATGWQQVGDLATATPGLPDTAVRSAGALRDAFHQLRLRAMVRSSDAEAPFGWVAEAGVATAPRHAPASLWSGAGSGRGAHALLRAHPLVTGDGVVAGPFFGPTLLHGSVEVRTWLARAGPAQVGAAAFIDAARMTRGGEGAAGGRGAIDAGVGARLRVPGLPGTIRIDGAIGLTRRASALSVGWRTPGQDTSSP